MDHKLKQYTITGMVCTLTIGFFLQFLYSWSKNHLLIGIFAPVNNSTWEHLKLLFIPISFYSAFEAWMISKEYPRLLPARIYGLAASLILYVLLSYTYIGIIGRKLLILDFAVFMIASVAAFLCSHWIQLKYRLSYSACERSLILLTALAVCFIFFTFFHPNIALFLPKS